MSKTKSKKRSHKRNQHRKKLATKSIGDLPLCSIYISLIVFFEMLLVVMVIISTPRNRHKIVPVESGITQTSKEVKENNVPKNHLASPDEIVTKQSEVQTKTHVEYATSKIDSNVVSKKDLAENQKSEVVDVEVVSSKDDKIAMNATKEKVEVEAKESKKDNTKENKLIESNVETTTKESTDTTDVVDASTDAVEENFAIAKNDNVIETDDIAPEGDILPKGDITNEDVTEEVLVGAEESIIEETNVGSIEPLETKKVTRSDDVELLANIMYAEEGVFLQNDPENAEMAHKLCGSVVLHRMEVNFGGANTMEDVLNAENQYASATKKRIKRGQEIPEVVYQWAEELLSAGPIGPRNLVYQAQFKQGDVFEKIGNQYFCISDKFDTDIPEITESEIVIEDTVEPQDIEEDSLVYDDLYTEEYDI